MATFGCMSRFCRRQSLALPQLALGTNTTTISGCGSLDFPQHCNKAVPQFPVFKEGWNFHP